MPHVVVKSFAEKSGKSVTEVDKIWKETEKEVRKSNKFKKEDGAFWAYINATVQKKLGINESISFKNYLHLTEDVIE